MILINFHSFDSFVISCGSVVVVADKPGWKTLRQMG